MHIEPACNDPYHYHCNESRNARSNNPGSSNIQLPRLHTNTTVTAPVANISTTNKTTTNLTKTNVTATNVTSSNVTKVNNTTVKK